MNKNDNSALVPKPPSAVEKTQPGAKRILSSMVTDALALAKTNVKAPVAASYPVSILFSAEHIIPKLKANERFAVIREMVAHLIDIGQIRPQDENVVVDAITKREKSMSTGYGFGFASPRGRVDCVKDIVFAIGVSASGVEFDALDNQPVNVFAMFIAPANSQSHEVELQRFGDEIAKTLCNTAVRSQLLHSNSAGEMWTILKPVYDAWALQAGQRVWREFELKWRFGARTSALIVKVASQFVSRIEISCGEKVADAKSIMGAMMVSSIDGADAGCGCHVKVSATGSDEVAAIDALTELFTCGSRVDRCTQPNCSLKPALTGYTRDTVSYGCKSGHAWTIPRIAEAAKADVKLDFTGKQPIGKCPNCGGNVFEVAAAYLCEQSRTDSQPCKFKLSKSVLQQSIEPEQMKRLLETGKTDWLDKWVSKSGHFFTARLYIGDEGEGKKVYFEFPPRNSDTTAHDLSTV